MTMGGAKRREERFFAALRMTKGGEAQNDNGRRKMAGGKKPGMAMRKAEGENFILLYHRSHREQRDFLAGRGLW